MDRKVLQAWSIALNSGKFEQTSSALCSMRLGPAVESTEYFVDSDGNAVRSTVTSRPIVKRYCCLGVLEEVVAKLKETGEFETSVPFGFEKPSESFIAGSNPNSESAYNKCGSTGKLSDQQLDALGLTSEQQDFLVSLNDNGAPFAAIAATLTQVIPQQPTYDREAERLLDVTAKDHTIDNGDVIEYDTYADLAGV